VDLVGRAPGAPEADGPPPAAGVLAEGGGVRPEPAPDLDAARTLLLDPGLVGVDRVEVDRVGVDRVGRLAGIAAEVPPDPPPGLSASFLRTHFKQ
jgi:hypothetical protein